MTTSQAARKPFRFKEEDVTRMILEFLANRDLSITQMALERETGVHNGSFSDDVLFLRQLILDGQWDDVLAFMQPLEALADFETKKVRYSINKHKYIELVSLHHLLDRSMKLIC